MSEAQIEAEYEAYKQTHGYHLALQEANEENAKKANIALNAATIPSPTNKYTQRSNFRRRKSVDKDITNVDTTNTNTNNTNGSGILKGMSSDDLAISMTGDSTNNTTTAATTTARNASPLTLQKERELAHKLKVIKGKGFKSNKFQYKPYKYPDDINVNPMDWLLSDEYMT